MCLVITQYRNAIIKVVTLIVLLGILSSCAKGKSETAVFELLSTETQGSTSTSPTGTPISNISPGSPDVTPVPLNPEIDEFIFAVGENTSPPPINVLEQLKYSAGFGGAESVCDKQDQWPARTMFWSLVGPRDQDSIIIDGDTIELEWNQSISLNLCGLRPEETITFQVLSPNGALFLEKPLIANVGWASEDYASVGEKLEFIFGMDTGVYIVSFVGESWNINILVKLSKPISPRLYPVATVNNENQFLLYNFQSNETVTLLIYEADTSKQYSDFNVKKLVDWKQVAVDENGKKLVQVRKNFPDYWSLIVIGNYSGEVHNFNELSYAYDNHNVLIPNYGLNLFLATEEENNNMRNILELAGYKDVTAPTTINYEVSIHPDEKIKWAFMWCAKDADNLRRNADNFTVEFYIQNIKVDYAYINSIDTTNKLNWYCHPYRIFIRGWESGKEYTLELRYILKKDWSDGENNYKAGSYRHIINVNVN